MNTLIRGAVNIARACVGNSIANTTTSLIKPYANAGIQGGLLKSTGFCRGSILQGLEQVRLGTSLLRQHKKWPHKRSTGRKLNLLEGKPFAKATVIKTVIKKPKKPNSANRKCVLVRLGNGKEFYAYVPGIGHNLQEHHIVLVQPGRLQDTPGVNLVCVRGKYDLPHVVPQK